MKSRWIEHKGKRVFLSDYSQNGTNVRTVQEEADYVIEVLTKEPPHSVLSITNVGGTKGTRPILKVLQGVLPYTNTHVKKRAVIGATGLRWTIADAFNQLAGRSRFNPFDSLEDALDWIVQE